jgi:hypothetical protein
MQAVLIACAHSRPDNKGVESIRSGILDLGPMPDPRIKFDSMSRVSAVHDEHLPCGEGGCIRAEKQNHPCHLFRLREASNRRVRQKMAAKIGTAESRFRH